MTKTHTYKLIRCKTGFVLLVFAKTFLRTRCSFAIKGSITPDWFRIGRFNYDLSIRLQYKALVFLATVSGSGVFAPGESDIIQLVERSYAVYTQLPADRIRGLSLIQASRKVNLS